ncbi:MAG: DNA-binding protein [Candidatus Binatia bacterium]
MATITIALPDDCLRRLEDLASRLHTTPEELVLTGIEALLTRSEEEFHRASEFVLAKNIELYKRLA